MNLIEAIQSVRRVFPGTIVVKDKDLNHYERRLVQASLAISESHGPEEEGDLSCYL